MNAKEVFDSTGVDCAFDRYRRLAALVMMGRGERSAEYITQWSSAATLWRSDSGEDMTVSIGDIPEAIIVVEKGVASVEYAGHRTRVTIVDFDEKEER